MRAERILVSTSAAVRQDDGRMAAVEPSLDISGAPRRGLERCHAIGDALVIDARDRFRVPPRR
jgi:hypothetical protein